ncbi:MAG TPA: EF-P lysine aminoacylase EpmA [Pirellulales bacterium]|nr:EF-P lysine aminoacylase EpmA [Pirellulales bacterium]
MDPDAAQSDFLPTASWPMLRKRAELLARVRSFFAERAFLEVETPLLSADTIVDRHLDPLRVILPEDPRDPTHGPTRWLQTSPEFGMKRLMAAGGEAIFQITRAFRAGESGERHNPEFTMVEWYRRGDTLEQGVQLLSDLAEALFERGPSELVSYADAFRRAGLVDPHRATPHELAAAARERKISISDSMASADRDTWLHLLMSHVVEPGLGRDRPAIVCDYPASQAALARLRGNPPLAERFELYVGGMELANGYHELVDAQVLRQRNRQANAERRADGKPSLPEESRLLTAMEHGLPECTGVALGFDRVVMVATGAQHIREVIAFPSDRA